MAKRVLFMSVALLMGNVAYAQEKPPVDPVDVKDSITKTPIDELVGWLSGSDADRQIAESELPRRGKAATPGLLACLVESSKSTEARVSAAKCLRKIKGETDQAYQARASSAVPALLDAYKNQGYPLAVRGEAALALGELNATNAIPDLIEGLANNMFKVSETARASLVKMGAPAVEPLIAAYDREMAVVENPKWKEKEKEAYSARDGLVFRALLILGDVGGEKARAALASAIKTSKGSRAVGVRHHAALAMGLLRESGDKDYKQAIDPLINAFAEEKDSLVAKFILRSLEWLTQPARQSLGDTDDLGQIPYRWKAWWNVNKDRILGTHDASDDNIEVPVPAPGTPLKPVEPKQK
ncbi:MAG TPA: hypothetical protein VFF73_13950 [Planctomycetota bacterium]|nr:hypothetical protein [Planctomycetota bacterium]